MIQTLENNKIEYCPSFGECGGCSMRDVDYAEQLERKHSELIDVFGGIPAPEINPVVPSPEINYYRNRMDFVFGGAKGNVLAGLRKKGGFNKIVHLEKCPLFSPAGDRIRKFACSYFSETLLEPYEIRSHKGVLRYLVLRESKNAGDLMVNLITTEVSEKIIAGFAEALQNNFDEISTFVWSVNNGVSDVSGGVVKKVFFGSGYIKEHISKINFRISPYSFFQTNTKCAEKVYDYARMSAGGSRYILDLYCGAGGFGLALSGSAKCVFGVEINFGALEDASANAEENNINNCAFVNSRAEKIISALRFGSSDLIVIDPPRSGIQAKAARKFNESAVENILYVSCNPATLTADLRILCQTFRVNEVQPFDMFPHTPHIETVVKLTRKKVIPEIAQKPPLVIPE